MYERSLNHAVITPAILLIVGLLNPATIEADQQIRWRTGVVSTNTQTSAEVANAIAELTTDPSCRHLVVQFNAGVGPAEHAKAEAAGLRLQTYLNDNAFFASVAPGGVDAEALAQIESLVSARMIERNWKLHPMLAAGEVPTWAVVSPLPGKAKDDPVVMGAYVLFHPDVPLVPQGLSIVRRHGAKIRSDLQSINGLVIELPLANLKDLADEDAVQWIEPPLPPMDETNNSNRDITGANIVQDPPYNLDGTGVSVLVYDGGYGLSSHVDFGGRHSVRDSSGLSDHATHVACTVGGSGAASSGNYRGMAPGVTIESYGFEQEGGLQAGFLYTDPGDLEDDYNEAINTYGVHISNNSIGSNVEPNGFDCTWQGDYGATAALIDAIVGGSLGAPFRVVWANGNERQGSRCDVEGYGDYYSIAPPAGAKNHITVGALNSNDDSMTSFSSWGPTDDGRIKPDISAPGCQSNDDYDVTSCSSYGNTSYTGKCGTSMASPTVTGLSALLLQDFRDQFPGEPDFRNSTLKVLLAHNAVDLGSTGPDYKFGYGSVRIQPTVDFMRTGNFLEAEVNNGGAYAVIVVVDPADSFLKITLAWDDVPGTANVNPALVNDLDLVVYDPSGVRRYPWTLNPTNPSGAAVQTQADHLNNIEQVYVASPAAGAWQVEIQGFNVPQGPQVFSLAASPYLVNCSTVGVNSLDRLIYPCEGLAEIQVIDCDLNTDNDIVDTVTVTVDSDSEPGGETVLLTETAAESAAFRGIISLSATDAEGVLQVTHEDTVTTTYIDEDDGYGGINVVVEATAVVDCQAPVISNVQAIDVNPRNATITFDIDELATGTVYYGLSCSALNESASAPGYKTSHAVTLTGLEDDRTYFYAITVRDQAGNPAIDNNDGNCHLFVTPDIPDFFTEEFGGDHDLDGLSVEFHPDGSFDYYSACVEPEITELPTDPSGGTSLSFSPSDDDGYANVSLSGGQTVALYGTTYSSFYVGTNGYITFGTSDTDYTESLSDHFALPRISALFDDLNPSAGGTVSWKQLSDRAAVTWENIPKYYDEGSNTFQIEMFFDGTITISYLGITNTEGIAGLSAGDGLSPDFYETDLSTKGPCAPPGDCDEDGDIDEDDYAVFVDCFTGPGGVAGPECACVSLDLDEDVDCKDWNLFQQLWSGPGDPPTFGPCAQPMAWAVGGRFLAITPVAGSDPVALLITGDPRDPGVSCFSMYVQADGSLDTAPVFRPPTGPDGWNTVHVYGEELMPNTLYDVDADYGSPGNPVLSPSRSVTTWLWGDVEHNEIVNFTDVQWVVLGFETGSSPASYEAMNIAPCDTDDAVNFTDIQAGIMAFEGTEYRGGACTPPCP